MARGPQKPSEYQAAVKALANTNRLLEAQIELADAIRAGTRPRPGDAIPPQLRNGSRAARALWRNGGSDPRWILG